MPLDFYFLSSFCPQNYITIFSEIRPARGKKETNKKVPQIGIHFLKKNQTTPRPSEHPPVMGEKMSKRLGGVKGLQIQNHFMAFEQVPRCR